MARKRITFWVDEEELRKARQHAASEGLDFNDVAREWLVRNANGEEPVVNTSNLADLRATRR